MDSSRLRTGEMVAGIGGLALFVFLFFDWFGGGVEVSGSVLTGTAKVEEAGISGWNALSDLPGFLIMLSGVAGLALAYLAATGQRVNAPVQRGTVTFLLGTLAVLLILWRMVAGTPSLKIGVFLGLGAAIAITVGALMALRRGRIRAAGRSARRAHEGRVGQPDLRARRGGRRGHPFNAAPGGRPRAQCRVEFRWVDDHPSGTSQEGPGQEDRVGIEVEVVFGQVALRRCQAQLDVQVAVDEEITAPLKRLTSVARGIYRVPRAAAVGAAKAESLPRRRHGKAFPGADDRGGVRHRRADRDVPPVDRDQRPRSARGVNRATRRTCGRAPRSTSIC